MQDGLDDDDTNDCIDHIECISGIRLTPEQLDGMLDKTLTAEISEWGVEDTEVGGRIASAVSVHLLGQPWPLHGDNANIDAYLSELQAAARKRGYEITEFADDGADNRRKDSTSGAKSQQVSHVVVVGDERPSMLERLTPQEREELFSWSREQKPSSPGGSIDLVAWPGWAAALHRVQADSTAAWGTALDVIDRIKLNSAK